MIERPCVCGQPRDYYHSFCAECQREVIWLQRYIKHKRRIGAFMGHGRQRAARGISARAVE